MESELLNKITKLLEDKKAIDLTTIDVKEKTTLADYFVLTSGTSTTHIRALADNVEEELKKEGFEEPNEKQINQFILSNVRFKKEHRGRMENFMTYSYVANVLIITINEDHSFYSLFIDKLYENDDDRIAYCYRHTWCTCHGSIYLSHYISAQHGAA